MTPLRMIIDVILVAIISAMGLFLYDVLGMPGKSFRGTQPPPTAEEIGIASDVKETIQMLAGTIGEHNSAKYEQLNAAADYLAKRFRDFGYEAKIQSYDIDHYEYKNIWAELPGTSRAKEIIVIGAHYDSVRVAPGANDNGTGTATVLELAKLLRQTHPERTIRFVLFTNEEPPYFSSMEMGSYHYATMCHDAGDNIVAMFCPETMGYYTDAPHSQHYPAVVGPFYPKEGNFIAFVANRKSRKLVQTCVKIFRDTTPLPSEGIAAPEWINGVDWADQYWFWKYGYPGVMITDTAPYRYPYYHTAEDTPDKINYPAFSRVVSGLHRVVDTIANPT